MIYFSNKIAIYLWNSSPFFKNKLKKGNILVLLTYSVQISHAFHWQNLNLILFWKLFRNLVLMVKKFLIFQRIKKKSWKMFLTKGYFFKNTILNVNQKRNSNTKNCLFFILLLLFIVRTHFYFLASFYCTY